MISSLFRAICSDVIFLIFILSSFHRILTPCQHIDDTYALTRCQDIFEEGLLIPSGAKSGEHIQDV